MRLCSPAGRSRRRLLAHRHSPPFGMSCAASSGRWARARCGIPSPVGSGMLCAAARIVRRPRSELPDAPRSFPRSRCRGGQNGGVTTTALALLTPPSAEAPPHREGAAPWELVDPDAPHVRILDLGVTRGDGVFETISVGAGRPQALVPHLKRLARSAASLELPVPDLEAWEGAVRAAADGIDPLPEAFVKTILTRGVEGDGRPTGWAYAAPAEDFRAVRRDGIRVVLLDRGYRHDVAQTSPWLLQGAKTLSYAVNRAVLREARRRDAHDVVFVSSDGYLLEGSTSNLLLRVGDTLVTPGTHLGILTGTTQADLFTFAAQQGLATSYGLLRSEDLHAADAAWLVSSVRHAAPIRSVDGVDHAIDAEFTTALNAYLVARTE